MYKRQPPKKVLQKVNEKDECVNLTITDCEQGIMDADNMTCIKCIDGKLPASDKLTCVSPTTAITDCLRYDQSSDKDSPICKRCEDSKMLNITGNECSSPDQITSGNCLHGKQLSDLKCMQCSAGYAHDGTSCVSCGGNGCLICNEKDNEKCFVCKPLFTMSISGVCEPTYPKSPTSVMILNSMFLSMIMLMIFKYNSD